MTQALQCRLTSSLQLESEAQERDAIVAKSGQSWSMYGGAHMGQLGTLVAVTQAALELERVAAAGAQVFRGVSKATLWGYPPSVP